MSAYPNKLEPIRKSLERFKVGVLEIEQDVAFGHPDTVRIRDARVRLEKVLRGLQREETELTKLCPDGTPISEDHFVRVERLDRRTIAFDADLNDLSSTIVLRCQSTATQNGRVTHPSEICEAADRMIEGFFDKLGEPRTNYVLVAGADSFTPDSSAIHLSRNNLEFWNLNRAVHEFGHLWGEEFASKAGEAQADFIAAAKDYLNKPLAQELFADIVATLLLGPAYAHSALFLDFSPADRKPTDTHPSGDERVHVILLVLKKLAKSFDRTTLPRFENLVDRLAGSWADRRYKAGARNPVRNELELRDLVNELCVRLDEEHPGLKYNSLSPAYCVLQTMDRKPVRLPAGVNSVDILNGAWLKSLSSENQQATIERIALEMLVLK